MISRSPEFAALNELSARVGANPAWVQGAGGNTSIKEQGMLWIKASGLWLAHARQQEIMVPVALDALLDAMERGDPLAEQAQHFVRGELNPLGLRPSIETTFHAVIPQRVVVHVHCVETIALAVAAEAESMVGKRLAGFRHAFIPYVRPGLSLARAMATSLDGGTDVLVLGNHGLVVAADTVAGAALFVRTSHRRVGDLSACGAACRYRSVGTSGGGFKLSTSRGSGPACPRHRSRELPGCRRRQFVSRSCDLSGHRHHHCQGG